MRKAFTIAVAAFSLLVVSGPIAQALEPRVVVVEFFGAVY